jgi:hypothetical protein
MMYEDRLFQRACIVDGYFRNLNWRYLLYIRHFLGRNFRDFLQKIWPNMGAHAINNSQFGDG